MRMKTTTLTKNSVVKTWMVEKLQVGQIQMKVKIQWFNFNFICVL